MKAEEIHINDFMRILFGNTPPVFLIEVIIRISFLILLVMIAIRIMGKRMSSQLSLQEMGMLVILAGAIGIPMQSPERGLLPPVIIAVFAIVVQRVVGKWSFRDKKVELLTQGDASILVEDGIMNLKNIKKNGLTRERVFAELRSNNIKSLGGVKRLYMEANGSFSILKINDNKPGLSLVPLIDKELLDKQKKVTDFSSCRSCGFTNEKNNLTTSNCHHCNSDRWVDAII